MAFRETDITRYFFDFTFSMRSWPASHFFRYRTISSGFCRLLDVYFSFLYAIHIYEFDAIFLLDGFSLFRPFLLLAASYIIFFIVKSHGRWSRVGGRIIAMRPMPLFLTPHVYELQPDIIAQTSHWPNRLISLTIASFLYAFFRALYR